MRSVRSGVGVLRSVVNPVTGQFEWQVQAEDYDLIQETARSSFGDMLRDTERNILYERALNQIINSSPKDVRVLDIGTGTGLLSMMAAKNGAKSVIACETFEPMAQVAKKIIEANGFSDKIQVVSKRSTDMQSDEVERADICVAEVFDTELIGEGALRTFADAHRDLLKPGARVIPSKARIYVQPVESEFALSWFNARRICIPEHAIEINPPSLCVECSGNGAVHDIQMAQFTQYNPVCDPIPVFDFDFESPNIEFDRETVVKIKKSEWSTASKVDVLLFWWDLDMDGTGNIILSTKPSKLTQWRDHWMQAVYSLPSSMNIDASTSMDLLCTHDEYSLWFNVGDGDRQRPRCVCGLHNIHSRTSLARFNNDKLYRKWANSLTQFNQARSILVYGSCSLLPLLAASLGFDVVYVESSSHSRNIIQAYSKENHVDDKISIVENIESMDSDFQPDLVISDPFFFSSMLPWHNLHFWYFFQDNLELFAKSTALPCRAELWCLPMSFDNLHKIRAPVGKVEGFDLSLFDDLCQESMAECDGVVESHPLWEYPGLSVGEATCLLCFDDPQSPLENLERAVQLHLVAPGNGIAFWMKWWISEKSWVSTGLIKDSVRPGDIPEWDSTTNQGVVFLRENQSTFIDVTARFDKKTGNVNIGSTHEYHNYST